MDLCYSIKTNDNKCIIYSIPAPFKVENNVKSLSIMVILSGNVIHQLIDANNVFDYHIQMMSVPFMKSIHLTELL